MHRRLRLASALRTTCAQPAEPRSSPSSGASSPRVRTSGRTGRPSRSRNPQCGRRRMACNRPLRGLPTRGLATLASLALDDPVELAQSAAPAQRATPDRLPSSSHRRYPSARVQGWRGRPHGTGAVHTQGQSATARIRAYPMRVDTKWAPLVMAMRWHPCLARPGAFAGLPPLRTRSCRRSRLETWASRTMGPPRAAAGCCRALERWSAHVRARSLGNPEWCLSSVAESAR
mmetsp:Transcript_75750/g.209012  ORF Transcript_75750/g.209012 Transcript_75750/m.209012 type:complete len:231 (+) Transcript_75750:353-1045(+)